MKIRLFTLSLALLFCVLSTRAQAQLPPFGAGGQGRVNGVFDFIDLTGTENGNDGIEDFVLFPYGPNGPNRGGLGFAVRSQNFASFNMADNTPVGSFSMTASGFGVGLDGIGIIPESTLHVRGGMGLPFPTGQAFIQDTSNDGNLRNILRLQNGGPVAQTFEDANSNQTYSLTNGFGGFFLEDTTNGLNIPLFVGNGAPNNLLNLDPSGGVGINTSPNINQPVAAMLHITADSFGGANSSGAVPLIRGDVTVGGGPTDRTLIDLRNNGKAAISLLDTGAGATTGYNINVEQSSGGDRMRFEKTSGAIRASAAFFGDGHVRYSVNAKPNFTVKPNGDLNVLGQAPNSIPDGNGGFYPSGGNLNVNGFIDSNNPNNSRPGNLRVTGDARVLGTIFGTLSQGSDRNSKENIEPVDTRRVLNQVSRMPITTWNYKDDKNQVPHMGPMSQDFHNSFGLGDDRKRIYSIDQAGVALAAIQGLNDVVKSKGKEIDRLREKTEAQAELIDQLMQRLESLEASLPQSQR